MSMRTLVLLMVQYTAIVLFLTMIVALIFGGLNIWLGFSAMLAAMALYVGNICLHPDEL